MKQKRASKKWERHHAARAREHQFWQSNRGHTLIGNMTRAANRLLSRRAETRERATMSLEDQRSHSFNRPRMNRIMHIPLAGLGHNTASIGWLKNLRK